MKDIIESPYGEEDHIRKRSLTDDVMQFTPSPHMFDNLVMKETEPQQEVQASSKVEKEKEKSTKEDAQKTKQSIRPLKNTNVFSNCDYEYRNSTDDEKRDALENKQISPPHSHTSSNDDDDDSNSNSTEFIIDI